MTALTQWRWWTNLGRTPVVFNGLRTYGSIYHIGVWTFRLTSGLWKNKKIVENIHDGQNGFMQKFFRFNDLTDKIDAMMAKKIFS